MFYTATVNAGQVPCWFPGPYVRSQHQEERLCCAAQQLSPLFGTCAVLGEGSWLEHGAGNTRVVDSVPLLAIYFRVGLNAPLWVPSNCDYSVNPCESCRSNVVGRNKEICPPLCWPSKCRCRKLLFLSKYRPSLDLLVGGYAAGWIVSVSKGQLC